MVNCSTLPAQTWDPDPNLLQINIAQIFISCIAMILNASVIFVSYGKKFVVEPYKIPFVTLAVADFLYCITTIINAISNRDFAYKFFEVLVSDYPHICRLQASSLIIFLG